MPYISGATENTVEVRGAHGALGFGHLGALLIDDNASGSLALLLAFHAVEFAFISFFSHDNSSKRYRVVNLFPSALTENIAVDR